MNLRYVAIRPDQIRRVLMGSILSLCVAGIDDIISGISKKQRDKPSAAAILDQNSFGFWNAIIMVRMKSTILALV